MNISDAKQETKRLISSFLLKDESGEYAVAVKHRRPVLLMGPPGIGKTAVVEQIADELGINLVSYTITHHTRQSAIGLPVVNKKTFGGETFDITEYTMSEIIAEVYKKIEASGDERGILFLDEINCVSETLAPTMLQFLQYKTFGTHRLPDGFVLVCAGNPPAYNKSVRDFDLVTLDRLIRIDISEDYEAWKGFASKARIHGSIVAYLDIKHDHFYSVSETVSGTEFVTARGWEDLSMLIYAYEAQGLSVSENVIGGFLQAREVARDFSVYYELYQKYKSKYRIADIISGALKDGGDEVAKAPFDEKLSLLHLLFDALDNSFSDYVKRLDAQLKLRDEAAAIKEAGDPSDERLSQIKVEFEKSESIRQEKIDRTDTCLDNVFEFLVRTFGEGQELVIFLTFLSTGYYSKKYLTDIGNGSYEKYDRLLLLHDERSAIKREILKLGEI